MLNATIFLCCDMRYNCHYDNRLDKTDSCEFNSSAPARFTNLMLALKQGVKPEAFSVKLITKASARASKCPWKSPWSRRHLNRYWKKSGTRLLQTKLESIWIFQSNPTHNCIIWLFLCTVKSETFFTPGCGLISGAVSCYQLHKTESFPGFGCLFRECNPL